MNVGQRIKSRRNQLKLSVDDLALKIDKNRTTIYRYENGYIENLPTTILEPLAKALYTTPEYLMGWTDDPNDYEDIANDEGWNVPNDFFPDLDQEDRLKKYYDFKRAEESDYYTELYDSNDRQFTNVDDAMLFIIQNPTVAAHGGYDIDRMTDEDKIEFANQIADTIKFFGQKYKK